MTSPSDPTESSPTPIHDVLRKLGIGPNPLPPDDEVYSSGALILFVSGGGQHQVDQDGDAAV